MGTPGAGGGVEHSCPENLQERGSFVPRSRARRTRGKPWRGWDVSLLLERGQWAGRGCVCAAGAQGLPRGSRQPCCQSSSGRDSRELGVTSAKLKEPSGLSAAHKGSPTTRLLPRTGWVPGSSVPSLPHPSPHRGNGLHEGRRPAAGMCNADKPPWSCPWAPDSPSSRLAGEDPRGTGGVPSRDFLPDTWGGLPGGPPHSAQPRTRHPLWQGQRERHVQARS